MLSNGFYNFEINLEFENLLHQARLLIMLDLQLQENYIIMKFYSVGMVLSEFLMIY